jgi:Fic family protein
MATESDKAALKEASENRRAKWAGIYARVREVAERNPELTPTDIARRLGIGRETAVRALRKGKVEP